MSIGLDISPAARVVRLSWPPDEMDSPKLLRSFEEQALGDKFEVRTYRIVLLREKMKTLLYNLKLGLKKSR